MAIKTGNGDNNIIFGSQQDDKIYGKGGNDILLGGGGEDLLDGGTGADTMQGGLHSDDYVVDNVNDKVVEYADGGNWDEVFSSITYTLPAYVEYLHLTGFANISGTGNELDNFIWGNDGNNTLSGGGGDDFLYGGAGNDTLIGGSSEFSDHLYGGNGNDIYVIDGDGTDWVTEYSGVGSGTDTVVSSVTFWLPQNVENLILTGSDDLEGKGNELDNVIVGNDGNNHIDGKAGTDTMRGGDGDDWYEVDQTSDAIVEYDGEGTDKVYASASYTLGANVENLYLRGSDNIDGSGNDLDNIIWGNDGNNTLYGHGGDDILVGLWGNDTMYGGAGDDSYTINDEGDVVVELANEGNHDRIYVLGDLSWTLADNIEDLHLDWNGQGVYATGNASSNWITGSLANNVIDGGLGQDVMSGGLGDDVYLVDNVWDTVYENANEGHDTVFSSVDYTLSGNVEALSLDIGNAVYGTGNTLSNTIYGNAGNNVLDGRAGADALSGLGGSDTFMFQAGEANGDRVYEFNGNGAADGDMLVFSGYGQGATFVHLGGDAWQITSANGLIQETIHLEGSPTIDASDYILG